MNIYDIISWTSTAFFLIGALLYSSKKASNPLQRLKGFILFEVGSFFFILANFIVFNPAFIITQGFFSLVDLRGIINCYREYKNARK